MKDSRNTPWGSRLGALLLIALLTGCSSLSTSEPTPDATTTGVAASPSTTTTEPAPAQADVKAGDTLDAKPDGLPTGLKAYQLPDATYAVVAADQPFPDSVRADIQGKVDSRIQDPGTPEAAGTNRTLIIDTAQEIASLAGLQSGKSVVIIFPLVGSCPGDDDAYLGWAHTRVEGDLGDCIVLPSFEASQAEVTGLIAASKASEQYEVFVHAN